MELEDTRATILWSLVTSVAPDEEGLSQYESGEEQGQAETEAVQEALEKLKKLDERWAARQSKPVQNGKVNG